jgi:hypothetical protein
MTKDKLIELAQVGMGIHSPNQPEYIVCEALIKALAQPPQRKPLTDEEIGNCIDEVNLTSEYGHHHFGWHKQFARAIEAAHNIK